MLVFQHVFHGLAGACVEVSRRIGVQPGAHYFLQIQDLLQQFRGFLDDIVSQGMHQLMNQGGSYIRCR